MKAQRNLSETEIFNNYVSTNNKEQFPLSDDIQILDTISHQYSIFEHSGLFEGRNFTTQTYPGSLEDLDNIKAPIVKVEDLDIWSINFPESLSARDEKWS